MFFLLPVPHDLHIVFPYIKNGVYTAFAIIALYVLFKTFSRERKADRHLADMDVFVELEHVGSHNKEYLLQLQRKDIPVSYAANVADTIAMAEYGKSKGLPGHCYAIKYKQKYVGILLLRQAVESRYDPVEIRGRRFFRLMSFLIDSQYQRIGIGTVALQKAIDNMFDEYGPAPILLECHKDNHKAIEFYKKNGFVNTGKLNRNETDYFMILE